MNLFVMCCKIFFVRIIDVSLGTFVTILTVKGKRTIATVIGFIDVLIWFLIVKEALNTGINSIWIAIAYSGGYAVGTFVGTTLSDKLIKGKVEVQVVLDNKYEDEINAIRNSGYAVSQVDCTGKDNTKKAMLFIGADKKDLNDLKRTIRKIDNKAFMIINETKYVENGFFKDAR